MAGDMAAPLQHSAPRETALASRKCICTTNNCHHAEAVHIDWCVCVTQYEPDVSMEVCRLQVDLFEDTQACAIHARRITIM